MYQNTRMVHRLVSHAVEDTALQPVFARGHRLSARKKNKDDKAEKKALTKGSINEHITRIPCRGT